MFYIKCNFTKLARLALASILCLMLSTNSYSMEQKQAGDYCEKQKVKKNQEVNFAENGLHELDLNSGTPQLLAKHLLHPSHTIGQKVYQDFMSKNGQCILNYDAPVTSISWSPDGQLRASAAGKTAKIWNLKGQCLRTLNHDAAVYSVSWSLDSKFLATNDGNTAKIWTVGEYNQAVENLVNSIAEKAKKAKKTEEKTEQTEEFWKTFVMFISKKSYWKNHR